MDANDDADDEDKDDAEGIFTTITVMVVMGAAIMMFTGTLEFRRVSEFRTSTLLPSRRGNDKHI